MTKTRSPEYPAIGLGDAIDKVKVVYERDYQNKLSKAVIAEHLGYKSLSGASLPILAALNKYGLLEGRGDETHVSDLALHIVAHDPGSSERLHAIQTAAAKPELFVELSRQFPNGKASDSAIRAYLLTRKFIPSAADTAIRTYRETNQLVEVERAAYATANPEAAFQVEMSEQMQDAQDRGKTPWEPGSRPKQPSMQQEEPQRIGTRKEIITLDEGDVVITFPESLSAASFYDLQGHLNLFLRKAQRRSAVGDYFAEIYAPDGIKAKEVRYFDDFHGLKGFMGEFKTRASQDVLRVHLPARASDDERRQVAEAGGSPA